LPHEDEELKNSIVNYPWRVFSLPPSTNEYIRILESFLNLSQNSHIILISSTSVFGENQGFISNDTQPIPSDERGNFCLQAEVLALNAKVKSLTIIRPAGLLDEERHPGKSLSGKQNLARGNSPINLIHTEDVARFILHLFQLDQRKDPPKNRLINLASSRHDSRKDFYEKYCLDHQLIPPCFNSEERELLEKKNKIIDDSHLLLNYNFLLKYPNLY